MDQNLQILLYFGGLMLIGAMATVAALVVMKREQDNKQRYKRLRKRPEDDTPAPTRQVQVQVVWAGEEMPLIWQVEGRPYAHPDSVTEPEQRVVVQQFIEKLGESLPSLLAPRPVPAAAAPLPTPRQAPPSPEPVTDSIAEPEESPPLPAAEEVAERVEVHEETEPELLGNPEAEEVPEVPLSEPIVEAAESAPLAAEESMELAQSASSLETPVTPPAERKKPSRPRTYEEMMELPFLERLKASFFTTPAPTSTDRLDQAERQALPTMPKVDDLNSILQRRLSLHADVPPASIRPTPQGLLEIIVDGKIYERIDDVPHEKVRETMREAVRIWERGLQ
jgi:hypothetical protein